MFHDERLMRKTFMLEFLSNGTSRDALALSLPPQSEEFTFPLRARETKTFGGSIIDDYGNDTARITLSGSTFNNESRMIKVGAGGKLPKFVSGDGEARALRDFIRKWSDISEWGAGSGKKTYLYDLDAGEWWDVAITEFQLRKSKDSPMSFNYTISMLAQSRPEPIVIGKSKMMKSLEAFRAKVDAALGKLRAGMAAMRAGLAAFKSALAWVDEIDAALSKFADALAEYEDIIDGYMEAAGTYVASPLRLFGTTMKEAARVVMRKPLSIYSRAKDVARTLGATAEFFNFGDESNETARMWTMLAKKYGETTEETKFSFLRELGALRDSADAIVSGCARMGETALVCEPGDAETDDSVSLSREKKNVTVKDGDTWDSIARDIYGDAGMAAALAAYNTLYNGGGGLPGAGGVVYAPVLDESLSPASAESRVIRAPGDIESLGRDVALGADGDLALDGKDLAVVAGKGALAQCVLNRLLTARGANARLSVYGIKASVGERAAEAYVKASVEQTMLAEPRVASLDAVDIAAEGGGAMAIKVRYVDTEGGESVVSA